MAMLVVEKGPAVLCNAMRYAVFSGGKRLRPLLTLESSRALKNDIKKAPCAAEQDAQGASEVGNDL